METNPSTLSQRSSSEKCTLLLESVFALAEAFDRGSGTKGSNGIGVPSLSGLHFVGVGVRGPSAGRDD